MTAKASNSKSACHAGVNAPTAFGCASFEYARNTAAVVFLVFCLILFSVLIRLGLLGLALILGAGLLGLRAPQS